MNRIYLDNGATSYPKAPKVEDTMYNFIKYSCCSINRSTSNEQYAIEDKVFETRELLCKLFNFKKAENVVFTKNITESLNILIKGMLNPGDHVIVSSMEHNAVMRPLNSICKNNIEYSRIPCSKEGILNPNDVESYIKPNTKAIIMTHCSNVCGTILPIEEIGLICKKHNLFFIVDAAQSAGVININMENFNIDGLCFTGHKSLLGPQGIGGFLINDKLNEKITPLIEGGTGSLSEEEIQPSYMPDKFEGGTPNTVGIIGLNTSLKYILDRGLNNILKHELELTSIFLDGLMEMKDIDIIGKKNLHNRLSVISISTPKYDLGELAYKLNNEYNIETRCGLHCAPSAHKTLNTFPCGTIRFSIGAFNSKKEILYTLNSLNKLLKTY